MKKTSTVLSICIFLISNNFADGEEYTPFEYAMRVGAMARLTTRVLTENDDVVTNIPIRHYYQISSYDSRSSVTNGYSDNNGLFTSEGLTTGYIYTTVETTNYYTSWNLFVASSRDPERLVNNKWLPWNPTNTIVLREIKNPIPMYVGTYSKTIPNGATLGFDLLRCSPMPPYGDGEIEDFTMTINVTTNNTKKAHEVITLTSSWTNGGFQIKKSYKDSIFKSEYNAPLSGYLSTIVSTNKHNWGKEDEGVYKEDEYMIFKTRVMVDDSGAETNAHYGKFQKNFGFSRGASLEKARFYFTYYFNPTSNCTNLEYDCMNNLFEDEDKIFPRHRSNP